MRNLLFILLAIALGYLTYERFLKDEPAAVNADETAQVVVSPEAAIETGLAGASTKATQLAELDVRYPNELQRALRDRLLTISGEIEEIRGKGVAQDVAEVVLRTSTPRRVRVEIDLNKYDRVRGVGKNANHYEVVGGELLKTDINGRQITVIFRVGQNFKQRVRFKNAGVTELIFEAE